MAVPFDVASLVADVKKAADDLVKSQEEGVHETYDDVYDFAFRIAETFHEHGYLDSLWNAVLLETRD